MDFRKLLQEERRRARESAPQKAPEAPQGAKPNEMHAEPRAGEVAASEEACGARNSQMSCWRPREPLDIERFRVPGIKSVFCVPEWLSQDEEDAILARVHGAAPSAWVQLKHRRLQMYGGDVKQPFTSEPLPAWLLQMVDALVANGAFTAEATPNHALINEYGVGDCILPHEDGPSYFPLVAIASTGADACFTFAPHREHADDAALQPIRFAVQRRSLLVFTEDAYTKYLHSTDGVESGKRVSLTIRHVRVDKTP